MIVEAHMGSNQSPALLQLIMVAVVIIMVTVMIMAIAMLTSVTDIIMMTETAILDLVAHTIALLQIFMTVAATVPAQ